MNSERSFLSDLISTWGRFEWTWTELAINISKNNSSCRSGKTFEPLAEGSQSFSIKPIVGRTFSHIHINNQLTH